MRTINFSDARSNLKQVLDDVVSDHTITLIKRHDTEDAVVMSLGDYNSILETLYLFGSRANAERLGAAMAEADTSLPAGARILGPEGAMARNTSAPRAGASKTSLKKRGTKILARGRTDDVDRSRKAYKSHSQKSFQEKEGISGNPKGKGRPLVDGSGLGRLSVLATT